MVGWCSGPLPQEHGAADTTAAGAGVPPHMEKPVAGVSSREQQYTSCFTECHAGHGG